MLRESGFQHFTDRDISIVQYVSAIISHRAALFVSITTACILNRVSSKDVTIAIDGSVYKKHPRMDGWLNRLIGKFVKPEKLVNHICTYNTFLFQRE